MLRYVETELAKKRGKMIGAGSGEEADHVDELYTVPDHLKVKKKNSESSTQWTTGIAEVQLPIEYKLRNIEETEAAKKVLQEKRLANKQKSDSNIPSSYSADYFQRGREHDEKLRRGFFLWETDADISDSILDHTKIEIPDIMKLQEAKQLILKFQKVQLQAGEKLLVMSSFSSVSASEKNSIQCEGSKILQIGC